MNNLFRISQSNNLLKRERIEAVFKDGLHYEMVSVISPSGYGKTQSAASFLADQDAHIIWMSFTELDNYAEHFWDTLCDALSVAGERFCHELKETGFPQDSIAMEHFVRRYSRQIPQDKPVIFVLDDCHLLKEEIVCHFIWSMVRFKVKNTTTFFLSRPDTVLNSADTLKGHSVLFINEQTLAFTADEIGEYLRLVEFPPSVSIVSSIYKQTEGWPIAVYLLVLYTRENPRAVVASEHFTYAILDNLIETELFSTYTEMQQRLLMRLSILEEIPVLYLEEIYQIRDTTEISSNMLIRYNPHSKSYHFHQMFREFLRKKFLLEDEVEKESTYQAAASWFRKYDRKIDALYFYRKLQDDRGMWGIIWQTVISPKTPAQELVVLLLEITHEYAQKVWYQNSWLPLIQAIFYSQLAEYEQAENIFGQIIKQQYHQPLQAQIVGEALLHLGFLKMLHGDVQFQQYFFRARAHMQKGSVICSKERMILLNGEGVTLCEGKAGEMERWVDAVCAAADDMDFLTHGSTYGLGEITAAQACYYRGEIEEAQRHAMRGLEQAREKVCVDIAGNAYYLLMKISMFYADYEKTSGYIKASYRYARRYSKNTSYNMPEIGEGYFYSVLGKNEKVMDWILNDSAYSDHLLRSNYGLERILKGHYYLCKKQYNELFLYLDETRKLYEKSNRFTAMIYIHLLYCFAYYHTGETEKAVAEFESAYEKSRPNNIIMPFVEMGRLTRGLVYWLQTKKVKISVPEEWLIMIRAKASTYRKRMVFIRQKYDKEHAERTEYDPLTRREKELLIYMGQGLTREEISYELHISANTVKSNLKLIYSKLGAVNGVHAMHIAMSSGLLEM